MIQETLQPEGGAPRRFPRCFGSRVSVKQSVPREPIRAHRRLRAYEKNECMMPPFHFRGQVTEAVLVTSYFCPCAVGRKTQTNLGLNYPRFSEEI